MSKTCFLCSLVLLLATPLWAQFQPQVAYPTGPGPFSIAVGDFNRDGIPDLAVVNHGADEVGVANSLSVLLGNGDGTFQAQSLYGVGWGPATVITADFNGDGKPDLAVANGESNVNEVFILLGNGDGSFGGGGPLVWPFHTPQWLAAGDFDGDGQVDLAVASYGTNGTFPSYPGTADVVLRNADGTYQRPTSYSAGTDPFGIMTADFNHDGFLDLAVTDNNPPFGVSIMLGNGDGTFQPAMFYATGRNPRIGAIADFNGDGNLDIAVANCIDNNVSILLGDGLGGFAAPVNYAAGTNIQLLAAGDFNGDGKTDLVTADSGSNTVSVLLGNGDGTFQSAIAYPVGNAPMWVAVADVNGDKAPDLVVANSGDNAVGVLLNKGIDFSISASAPTPATVTAGQSSTANISLTLLTWFNSPVTLTYSVQPTESAPECSLSPNPVTFDAQGNAAVTLTIKTATTAVSRNALGELSFAWLPLAGLALIGTAFGAKRGNGRKVTAYLMAGIVCCGLIFQSGCGTGGGGVTKISRPPQTFTITVTGAAGSIQHSATTTLTVDQ